MDQGWVLVILTSCITFSGCCVIYVDQIYSYLFPKRAAKKPFDIAHNTNFLICSLSLSSGCLLITSLYKLLPKSHHYLKNIPVFEDNPRWLKIAEYSSFLGGIVLCSLMNVLVHLFTNESLVHCAHDVPNEGAMDIHSHSHAAGDSLAEHQSHSHSHSHSQPHSHSHTDISKDCSDSSEEDTDAKSKCQQSSNSEGSSTSSHTHSGSLVALPQSNTKENVTAPENLEYPLSSTPYPEGRKLKKALSFMDLSLKRLKGETMTGPCYGDIDCCPDDILTQNKLHKHLSKELHYCSKPTEENLLFFPNRDHMITNKVEFSSRYPNLDIQSPLISQDQITNGNMYDSVVNGNNVPRKQANAPLYPVQSGLQVSKVQQSTGSSYVHNDHNDHNESTPLLAHKTDIESQTHQEHEHDHHHHIKTPLSRLLSIGLQTILAITLHKFPEGFIMYSTSKTNPELGLSIFLSMFIHNFVEGFTMTLPIYIALNSRIKAILIAGPLGSLSQPVGALLGYWFFKGNMDMGDPHSIVIIGILLAITAGFLTFISLQMFASSIAFGGKQEKVLKWCFFGIFLICLSDLLT